MPSDDVKAAEKRLKAAKDRASRQKMGKPLDLTDADLDDLSTITESDQKLAEADARRHGSPLFNALLNAKTAEDDG